MPSLAVSSPHRGNLFGVAALPVRPPVLPVQGLQRREVSLLQLVHLRLPVATRPAPLHPQRGADDGDASAPAGGAGQCRGEEDARRALEERREARAPAGRDRAEPRLVAEGVHGQQGGAVLQRELKEAPPPQQHEVGPVRPPVRGLRRAARPKRDGAAAAELRAEHGARGVDHPEGQEDVTQPCSRVRVRVRETSRSPAVG